LTCGYAACYEFAETEARIDEKPNNDGAETARRFWRAASLASIGLEMGVAVIVGWWIGQYLDGKLGTTPWLMIVCLLLGVGAAFKAIIREAKRIQSESKE
jgi:F0F1-type ATP synthase assembly protein I